MTPAELKEIRKALGMTQWEFGVLLGLKGKTIDRTVRSWELGEHKISGPVAALVATLRDGAKRS